MANINNKLNENELAEELVQAQKDLRWHIKQLK